MSAIVGIVRGGRIELDEPLDLPDGTAINIPLPTGLSNDDPPMTPEEIERTLAAMNALDLPPSAAADYEALDQKVNLLRARIESAERDER